MNRPSMRWVFTPSSIGVAGFLLSFRLAFGLKTDALQLWLQNDVIWRFSVLFSGFCNSSTLEDLEGQTTRDGKDCTSTRPGYQCTKS